MLLFPKQSVPTSGVSMQSGAHGKIYMCALTNNLNITYRYNFYDRINHK